MVAHFERNPHDAMRDFYRAHPELTIESLVTATCTESGIATKTFYKWRKQYLATGKFDRCETGLAQFGWLLSNNDKKMELTFWLKSQKHVSCGDTLDWINNTLLADQPVGKIPKFGTLKRPICYATTHHWMLCCNCVYEEVQKNHCNDSHERHGTLLYRTWHCDLDYFLSLRMHRWVCFSSSTLRKLKLQFPGDWPEDSLGHEIPIDDVGKFPPGWYKKLSSHTLISHMHVCTCTHTPLGSQVSGP